MKKLLILALSLTGPGAFAENIVNTTENSIIASLKCEPNGDSTKIIDAFRRLVVKKSELGQAGIQLTKDGEAMNERISLLFKNPIHLDGATATQVIFGLNEGSFITYGNFDGDAQILIEKLNLKQQIDQANKTDYLSGQMFDKKKNQCVPFMRLRKMDKQKFRFGCDWCNG
jgi:hypothetical protein